VRYSSSPRHARSARCSSAQRCTSAAHRGRLLEGGATLIVDLAGNRLAAIPLKLEFAPTRLADGDAAASVRRRFREACAAFGTEVAEEVGCLVARSR
jgi:hypothetical protein